MPRKLRHHRPNAAFHAGARGVDRQPIFLCDGDREFFLASIREALARTKTAMLGYVLMPNHFHLELGTSDIPLGAPLHDALTRHAVRFNRLHGRNGHLFEARFWSSECSTLDRIENTIAYIHLNPVRARIVAQPGDWRWSSHQAWADGTGSGIDFERLEAITGARFEDLQARYLARIERETSRQRRRSTPAELIEDVGSMFGLTPETLRTGKSEFLSDVKARLMARAEREGVSIPALASLLGCSHQTLYALRARKCNKSA